MATTLVRRVESWVRDQGARLPPWVPPIAVPRWPWPPLSAPAWPGDRRRQRERMFREEFERRRIQLRELCRAVRVDTIAELQELLCAMVLAECVYKRPVSEMMRYINKFKSDFGGNIISLERVQPSLDHVPHRYLLAEAGDTLFATFIGTNQYKDIIADVNILQGTIFHEDTAQDLADAIDSEQNSDQFGEENIEVSCREKPKQFGKSKPAAHRGFLARAKGIPALELYKLAQKKNRKLVLCGHSLGGAVAALATLAILRVLSLSSPTKEANRLQVKCITFSQPPVGNAALRDYVHRRGWQYYFKSYCIPEDVVPRILSPAYFHHYNAQTPEASFANRVDARSEENKKTSTEGAMDNNREQLVLGVGPVQKSLWRLSKLVPVEGVRKSLSVLKKQANIFEKASTQLDSYLQSKVDESEEEPWSLEIQEGSEGIALTPLSDNHGGTTEENNRTEKINSSKVGCSKRWSRVPSLPSYIPFGELYLLGDSSVTTLSDSEYSKMTSVQSVIMELRERLQSHSMKSYRARFQKMYHVCMCANAPLFTGIEQLQQFSHLQQLLGLTATDSVELGHIVEPPAIRTATSILPLGWTGLPGGKSAEPLKVDIIGHGLHMCTLFQAQINGSWYSTAVETLPSTTSYSLDQEVQPTLQKMRILVGRPLKQPPNYTSEDFMVPVVTGAMNPDYGVEPFEDKGCCKGLNEVIIYGTSDFVTICKEVYVRTRRVRLLGLEGAGKTSLIKAMLGQLKERNNAVLECIHVDLHGKAVSNGLCYLDSATVKLQELAREKLSLELAREKAVSRQAKQNTRKRDGSVTAAAVGASLGAGLGIVMAVIMGAASALRKP
ncbi:uncharacterized protein LOC125512585 isoform X5 [Triticum urartu]|uniref:uncharacterized protein LOC125512585 isoform X5 n=1 Tax=Triticum urartu TaxID=4572 RepID=UPI00204484E2|nr:uncharacterized protein LOC125512585 isoform X5 [Triticum urartu]